MKKLLSLAALGMAALGTTLWAQQDDEASTTKPAASAGGGGGSRYEANATSPAAPPDAAEKTDAKSGFGTFPDTASPPPASAARPNSRASAGVNRSAATFGQLGQQRVQPDGRASVAGPATPPPGYNLPQGWPSGPSYPQAAGGFYSSGEQNGFLSVGSNGVQYFQPYTQAEDPRSTQEFRETVDALRKAKTDEEKAEVREKLNNLVGKQIDQDLAEREKRLTELEDRAKQLREQLQQRKQTKAEIQKMLVMLIENPQGGLGLPPSWMNAINQPAYGGPWGTPAPYTTSTYQGNTRQ